jgi:hypothetical protein
VRHLGFGFFAQLAAAPVLLVGFAVLGIGLRKEGAVPRWVTLVMVGAVVCRTRISENSIRMNFPEGRSLLKKSALSW